MFGSWGPTAPGSPRPSDSLMDTIRPTRGTARVLGRDAHSESVSIKKDVGYLPGEIPDFGTLRGSEVVGYMAGLRRISPARRVAELCERLDIDLAQRFRDYSRGSKQKIGVVVAFMHDPRLLILDEPTSALDSLVQQEFYGLVRAARDARATRSGIGQERAAGERRRRATAGEATGRRGPAAACRRPPW